VQRVLASEKLNDLIYIYIVNRQTVHRFGVYPLISDEQTIYIIYIYKMLVSHRNIIQTICIIIIANWQHCEESTEIGEGMMKANALVCPSGECPMPILT